jgi:hypothetical protein
MQKSRSYHMTSIRDAVGRVSMLGVLQGRLLAASFTKLHESRLSRML